MPLTASEARPIYLRTALNLQAIVAEHPHEERPVRFMIHGALPAASAEAAPAEHAAKVASDVRGAIHKLIGERLKTTDSPSLDDWVEDASHEDALALAEAVVRAFS